MSERLPSWSPKYHHMHISGEAWTPNLADPFPEAMPTRLQLPFLWMMLILKGVCVYVVLRAWHPLISTHKGCSWHSKASSALRDSLHGGAQGHMVLGIKPRVAWDKHLCYHLNCFLHGVGIFLWTYSLLLVLFVHLLGPH